jgi:hypothetical protein
VKPKGEDVKPKKQQKVYDGLSVLAQTLHERPTAACDSLVRSQAWNESSRLSAPFFPVLVKCLVKFLVFLVDGRRIKKKHDSQE